MRSLQAMTLVTPARTKILVTATALLVMVLAEAGPIAAQPTLSGGASASTPTLSSQPVSSGVSVRQGSPLASLHAGQSLVAGQELTTGSGADFLVMQADGNLVEYTPKGSVVWASNTNGAPGAMATLLSNGNLEIVSKAAKPLWSTHAPGIAGATFAISATGSLSLTAPNGLIAWQDGSDTGCSLSALCRGQTLLAGETLTSPDGLTHLSVSTSGTLEIDGQSGALWQSPTSGSGASRLTLQSDGNLVLTTASGAPVYATQTGGEQVRTAQLVNGGTLILFAPGGWQMWSVGGPTATSQGRLRPGQTLGQNQSITSPDGSVQLTMTGLCNLVLTSNSAIVWQSRTTDRGAWVLSMGTDGNLVLYNLAGAPVWSSATNGHPASSLYVTDAGMLQIRRPEGSLFWNAGGSLASHIVSLAMSQDQFHAAVQADPFSSNCNPYTAVLGRTAASSWGCPFARGPYGGVQYLAEDWCSDFAQWVWQASGANVSDVSAWSFNFIVNGENLGTFQPGATNDPQPGDAVVWGDMAAGYGQHVGIVSAVSGSQISMISGNWGDEVADSGFFNPATYTVEGYPILGYIRPVSVFGASIVRAHIKPAIKSLAQIDMQDSSR